MRIPDPATEAAAIFARTLHLARSDYGEMPGLMLTPRQAARLWAADPEVCQQVLAALVASRYLAQVGDAFVRTCHGSASTGTTRPSGLTAGGSR